MHESPSPQNPSAPSASTSPPRRLGLLLVVMCSALALVVAATSSLALAVPAVAQELDATQSQTTWVVNAYALVFAALLLPAGLAADRYGRRAFLVAGMLLFAAASAASGFVDEPIGVIVLRGVAGLGAAAVMPATLSVLVDASPEDRRERAVSIWAAVSGAGAMVGLVGAGVLLDHFWWGSVQLATGLAATVVALACFLSVEPSRNPQLRLDPWGTLWSLVGLASVMFAVIQGPDSGWGSPDVLVAALLGVVTLGAFVAHELRSEAPMLDLRLFTSRRLSAGSGLVFVQFVAAYAFFVLSPQWLQYLRGQTPLEAAVWFLPFVLGVGPASAIAPATVKRLGPAVTGALGMTTMAAALLGMGYLGAVDEPLWWFGGTVVVFAFGFGLAATPGTSLIIAGLPEDRRTLSAAVNDVTREVGGALGGAIAASVLLASYSSTVGDLGGLPDQAADRAQEGFVQAMEVAQRLPAAERDRLIEAARNAFADGYSVALVIAAAVLVLGAVALLLRAGRGERA